MLHRSSSTAAASNLVSARSVQRRQGFVLRLQAFTTSYQRQRGSISEVRVQRKYRVLLRTCWTGRGRGRAVCSSEACKPACIFSDVKQRSTTAQRTYGTKPLETDRELWSKENRQAGHRRVAVRLHTCLQLSIPSSLPSVLNVPITHLLLSYSSPSHSHHAFMPPKQTLHLHPTPTARCEASQLLHGRHVGPRVSIPFAEGTCRAGWLHCNVVVLATLHCIIITASSKIKLITQMVLLV